MAELRLRRGKGSTDERRGDDASGVAEELLTSHEAQQLLKIGRTKLWELTRRNEIPAYRLGPGARSPLRYKRSEIMAWLERNRL